MLAAAALAAVLVLVAHPVAVAGNDALSNVAPSPQLPSGALANAYPLGNYALDHHFDAVDAGVFSGVDVSGIAPTIAWFLAQTIWMLTAFIANALILLFTFAFSLDLLNGSTAAGDTGALAPVSAAVREIYRDVFGQAWLVVGVLLTGLWAMWNALVRRRYTETAGALAVSLAFVTIAMAFVTRPELIAQASRWTNQMSSAFLSLSSDGDLTSTQRAKQANADRLFSVLIFEPWAVLNFGGLEHCVTGDGDSQRSVPVRPLSRDAVRDVTLERQLQAGTQIQADGKVCVNNRNKYAAHFLRFAPESDERNAEHDALKDGDSDKLPDADPGKADGSYKLGDVDKPAADAMGKGGQYQRLLLAIVIFAGQLGACLLLGALSVVVIVAQVLVLLLLAFAPVALVVGVFPGRGHDFFKAWLARLASYLLRKAIYSLLLAILLAVASALADATSGLGWLMAFGLQAVFYWTVLLNRHRLTAPLVQATTGETAPVPDGAGRIAAITYAAARLANRKRRTPQPPPPPPSFGADPAAAPAPLDPHQHDKDGGDRRDDRSAGDPGDSAAPVDDAAPNAASPEPAGPRPDEAGAAPDLPPRPTDDAAAEPPPPPDRPVDKRTGPQPQDPPRRQRASAPDAAGSYDSYAAPDLARQVPRGGQSTATSTARSQETSTDAAPDAHGAPALPPLTSRTVVERIQGDRTEGPTGPREASVDSGESPQRPSAERQETGDVVSSGGRDGAATSPLREGLHDDARRLHERACADLASQGAGPAADGEAGR